MLFSSKKSIHIILCISLNWERIYLWKSLDKIILASLSPYQKNHKHIQDSKCPFYVESQMHFQQALTDRLKNLFNVSINLFLMIFNDFKCEIT